MQYGVEEHLFERWRFLVKVTSQAGTLRTLVLFLFSLALTCSIGCAGRKQKVEYDLDDISTYSTGSLSTSTLVVEPLVDARDEQLRSQRGTELEPAIVYRDNDDWHLNSDDHYKSPVGAAVTEMLAPVSLQKSPEGEK